MVRLVGKFVMFMYDYKLHVSRWGLLLLRAIDDQHPHTHTRTPYFCNPILPDLSWLTQKSPPSQEYQASERMLPLDLLYWGKMSIRNIGP